MKLVNACLLVLLVLAAPVLAQDDAQARQAQAVQRLDQLLEHARRVGLPAFQPAVLAELDGLFERSNAELASAGDQRAVVLGLMKRGSVARLGNHNEAAVVFYEQAVQRARRIDDGTQQADALALLALTQINLRQYQLARDALREALPLAERAGDNDVLARVLEQHVGVSLAAGDINAAALAADREVDVASHAKDPHRRFVALSNRASVAVKRSEQCNYRPSYDVCLQALDAARLDLQAVHDVEVRQGHDFMASLVAGQLQSLEPRRVAIQGKLASIQQMGDTGLFHPREPGQVLVHEAFRASGANSFAAKMQFPQELARWRSSMAKFGLNPMDSAGLLIEGQIAEIEGRHDEALSLYLKSIDALELDRRLLRDEHLREGFMVDRMSVYETAIEHLLQRRRHAEAFELTERSRSRVLTELLAGRSPELSGSQDRALIAEANTLRARIAAAQARWVGVDSRERAEALAQRIQEDEARHRALMARIERESPRLAQLVSEQPATLEALQASMRAEGYETVQYQVTDTQLILWHITADDVFVRVVFLPRSQLVPKLKELRDSLANRDAKFNRPAEELYLYLVQPFVARLRSNRLLILPHGELDGLSFALLRNPQTGRFLAEDLRISYAPSASVALRLKPSPSLAGARVVGFADPVLDDRNRELRTLQRLFGARADVTLGEPPPKAMLAKALANRDVVHMNFHGHFDAREPMGSHLQLHAQAGEDGQLTAAEMFGLPLQSARLVVLSACDSGRVDSSQANESQGMARGLLYAGAQSLLLSQWQVDAATTADWMQAFYEAAQTRPLPEAVQAAALHVRNTPGHGHPFHWAAFTLISR